jgi:hypothetical protein
MISRRRKILNCWGGDPYSLKPQASSLKPQAARLKEASSDLRFAACG